MILKRFRRRLVEVGDLHGEQGRKFGIYIGFAVLVVLSIWIRKSLIHFQDTDYTSFSAWYDFAKVHGIHSLKYGASAGFSNYNPPYNYFLYIATLLPVSKIVALKGILAFFDVILAVSVYFVVKVVRPQNYTPLIAALTTMFLPTVLFNGVMWGQFDQLYVAFILFSLWAGLTGRSKWAWAFFGVAIAVKFQAVFFLPVLGIMSFKKINWYEFVWGVGAFLVLTLPPMLVGASLGSLLSIYPDQAKLFNGQVPLNAPNLYQWFPNSALHTLSNMGISLAIAVVILILIVSVLYRKFSNRDFLVVTTLILYVVPYTLPLMHERYFFPAGIASFVLACVYPTAQFIGLAILMQLITLLSYCPFLFGTNPVPLSILAIGILYIICMLGIQYLKNDFQLKPIRRGGLPAKR